MICEVVAVGTELLLGQIVDTNGAWLGEQLALAGIDVHHQVKVGDNHDRIVAALRQALERRRRRAGVRRARPDPGRHHPRRASPRCSGCRWCTTTRSRPASGRCSSHAVGGCRRTTCGRPQVPEGATAIADPQPGTAPGLICPTADGQQVIYAVPGRASGAAGHRRRRDPP